MVKQLQRTEVKTLKGGLITEAPLLQFPEGATQDELNFDIKMDGSRARRLGFDIEEGGSGKMTGKAWSAISSLTYKTYLWEQVGGAAGKQLLVVQIGSTLQFYDPNLPIVSGQTPLALSLPGANASNKFGMADVGGFLVVATGQPILHIVTYNPGNNSVSLKQDRIRIRDVFGIEETAIPEYENNMNFRGGLSTEHYYNLYNQGWAVPRYDFVYGVENVTDSVLLGSKSGVENFPGNADTVWMGMQERPIRKEGAAEDTRYISLECFHYEQFKAVRGASTPAARGYFIIDAFDRGASRIEQWEMNKRNYPEAGRIGAGIGNPPVDRTFGGPRCVADHAGRVFFAGMQGGSTGGDKRSPNYSNMIFFSQLVKQSADIVKCYQEGDPTSRESSDVVDTDGGFLRISDAKNILAMVSVGSRLIVLCENGIWAISGGSDYGFSATNYKTERLSNYGILGQDSVVLEGNTLYYWGSESIYRVGANQMGDYAAVDITSERIKRHYSTIAEIDKERVSGVYDKYLQRIVWVFPDLTSSLVQGVRNRFLTLDIPTGAFFPYAIDPNYNNRAVIVGGIPSPVATTTRALGDVVAARGSKIFDSDGNKVTAEIDVTIISVPKIKHIGFQRNSSGALEIFFGHFYRKDFTDWVSVDGVGVDAEAYLLTGAMTLGDAGVKKQIPYLSMFFVNTEEDIQNDEMVSPSSCLGRIQWDFANNPHSGRWSREVQMYRRKRHSYPHGDGEIYTGEQVLTTKNKVRGNGKAFALHLSTEPKHDLQIVGWNLSLTGNGVT